MRYSRDTRLKGVQGGDSKYCLSRLHHGSFRRTSGLYGMRQPSSDQMAMSPSGPIRNFTPGVAVTHLQPRCTYLPTIVCRSHLLSETIVATTQCLCCAAFLVEMRPQVLPRSRIDGRRQCNTYILFALRALGRKDSCNRFADRWASFQYNACSRCNRYHPVANCFAFLRRIAPNLNNPAEE